MAAYVAAALRFTTTHAEYENITLSRSNGTLQFFDRRADEQMDRSIIMCLRPFNPVWKGKGKIST